MSENTAVIWGASGHARVIADALDAVGGYELVKYVRNTDTGAKPGSFLGKPVLDVSEPGDLSVEDAGCVFLGFGDGPARLALGRELMALGFRLDPLVHPCAMVSDNISIGAGTVVLAGAVIDPGVTLGDFVIVNNGAIICHDSKIADGTHICPGVAIAGNVEVGKSSWIGLGSVVVNDLTLGSRVFVGAGSVVVKDLPDGVRAWGNPAKIRASMQ